MRKVNMSVMERLALHFGTKTVDDLCKKIDIPAGTYGYWRWKGKVPMRTIIKIAHDHGLNVDWIVSGEGEKYSNNEDHGEAV